MNTVNSAHDLAGHSRFPGPWENLKQAESLYVLPEFCQMAEVLRAQFEKQLSESAVINDGLTPLLLAFVQDTYQFLSASAERIFSQELLDQTTDRLREWGRENLGASFVSTPQVRVYTDGCWRVMLQDKTEARWHYLLSLTRNSAKRVGRVKLVTNSELKTTRAGTISIDRIANLQLQFNQLLLHRTQQAYAVELHKGAADPLKGSLFLDGYLW